MKISKTIRILSLSRKRSLGLLACLLAVCLGGGQPAFSQQLIHSYTFDKYEGTYGSGTQKIYNNVTGEYDATLFFAGAASYSTDEVNGKLTLVGTSNTVGVYVQLPNNLLTGLDALTIITEASYAEQRNWMRIFDLGVGEGVQDNYLLLSRTNNGNQLRTGIKSGGTEWSAHYGSLNDNTDYHFTYTYTPMKTDANKGVVTLYVDGEYNTSVTNTNPLSNITGSDSVNGNHLGKSKYPNDNYFHGTYDSFSVYDNVLGTTAVRDAYRNGTPSAAAIAIDALIDSSVAFWDGARGKDNINGNGVSFERGFSLESRTLADYAAADTLLGDGRVLVDGGVNKFAESRDAVLTNINGPLTISTRVYVESFNPWNDFIRSGNLEGGKIDQNLITYGLGANTENGETKLQFRLTGDGESFLQINSNIAAAEKTWYDITGVFDPDNDAATLYVYDSATGDLLDTVSQVVDFDTLDLFENVSLNFMLFESPNNRRETMDAMMDYAGVWNYAFTADQVGLLSGVQSADGGAVPEPATWVMLLLGAAAVGLMRWRRTRD